MPQLGKRTSAVLVGAVGCLLGAAACGTQTADRQNPAGAPAPAATGTSAPAPDVPNVNKLAITTLWDSIVYDYTRLDSPTDLIDDPETELVVTGRVTGFEPGPIYFAESADHPEASPNVVMSVAVDETYKGESPTSGKVYVSLDATEDLGTFRDTLPAGTVVALYLGRAPTENGSLIVGNEDAGHPAGEPLWQVGPQAFIVADNEDQGIVFPIDPHIAPNANFENQLPAGPTK